MRGANRRDDADTQTVHFASHKSSETKTSRMTHDNSRSDVQSTGTSVMKLYKCLPDCGVNTDAFANVESFVTGIERAKDGTPVVSGDVIYCIRDEA